MANPQAEPSMDDILASIRRIIAEEDDAGPTKPPVQKQLETLEAAQEVEEPVAEAEEALAEPELAAEEEVSAEAEIAEEAESDFDAIVGALQEQEEVETEVEAAAEELEATEAVAEEEADEITAVESFEEEVSEEPEMSVAEEQVEEIVEPDDIIVAEEPVAAVEVVEDTGIVVEEAPVEEAAAELSNETVSATASAFQALQESLKPAPQETPVGSVTLDALVERALQPLLIEWLDQNLADIVDRKVQEELRKITANN